MTVTIIERADNELLKTFVGAAQEIRNALEDQRQRLQPKIPDDGLYVSVSDAKTLLAAAQTLNFPQEYVAGLQETVRYAQGLALPDEIARVPFYVPAQGRPVHIHNPHIQGFADASARVLNALSEKMGREAGPA